MAYLASYVVGSVEGFVGAGGGKRDFVAHNFVFAIPCFDACFVVAAVEQCACVCGCFADQCCAAYQPAVKIETERTAGRTGGVVCEFRLVDVVIAVPFCVTAEVCLVDFQSWFV